MKHDVKLKMDSSNLTMKNRSTAKTDKIDVNDIENLQWLKRAKGHCLNVITKSGPAYKFDGLQEADYQKIDEFTNKHLKKHVEKKDLSIKGITQRTYLYNIGQTNIYCNRILTIWSLSPFL